MKVILLIALALLSSTGGGKQSSKKTKPCKDFTMRACATCPGTNQRQCTGGNLVSSCQGFQVQCGQNGGSCGDVALGGDCTGST